MVKNRPMPSIRPINTAILRRRFPEEYRRFFLANELVVSTADSFMLAGGYSAYYGGISICQKVPFRLYIGLKPILGRKIMVKKDYRVFLRSKDKFSRASFESGGIEGINKYLNGRFKARIRQKGGCRIAFFSEVRAEEGLGSLSTFCSLISLALHLYYFSLGKKDIARWAKVKVSQLIKKDKWFGRVFNLAWKINNAARNNITSGASAFVGLLNSGGFPLVYCSSQRLTLSKKRGHDFLYTGERMTDLLKSSSLTWHIDFGLIYSGIRESTTSKNLSIKKIEQELDQIKKDELVQKLQLKRVSSLFSHYSQKQSLWLVFMQMLDLISFQILLGLKNIFEHGSSDQSFAQLRDALNQKRFFIQMLGLAISKVDFLANIFQKQIKKKSRLGAGIEVASLGRGGYLVFFIPQYSLVNKEMNLEKDIKEGLNQDVFLGYLSWIDGIETGNVRIEQNLAGKIYSTFASHNEIEVKAYNHSFHPVSHLFSSETLEQRSKKIDLVLDEINHRIYLKGKRLTSKEISSARETIRVLALLLQKKGKLNNIDLLSNSYSINRYDFAGKILLPLKRAVKKILKKDLNLTVQGKIFSFSINFDPYNLRIWLINRRR